jgi:hypothetical protein
MSLGINERLVLENVLRELMGLGNAATFEFETNLFTKEPFQLFADLYIRDVDKVYLVEIDRRATVDKLSRLTLMEELVQKAGEKEGTDEAPREIHMVLAAKVIPGSVKDMAEMVGITVVQLPRHLAISDSTTVSEPHGKVTTEKAWRIVTRILKERISSIRQLAMKENVSYAWAHRTVNRLIQRGVLARKNNLVNIDDLNSLMNAVAWERPLKEMQAGLAQTSFTDVDDCAETFSRTMNSWAFDIAFSAYTSGTHYIGRGARHDRVYCYIRDDNVLRTLMEEFNVLDEGGVKCVLYLPDRDVFNDSREIDGVRITSPAQTLLDLAGLGYPARDMAMAMVSGYASIE